MGILNTIVLTAAVFLMSGCMKSEDTSERGEEKTGMEDRTEMTASEKQFLKSIYIDEERIEEGLLYSYQEDALEQYRFAGQYLEKKYPDYKLVITGGTPIDRRNAYAVFFFQDQEEDGDYEVHVALEEDEGYAGEDNFYGSIIREPYDRYIYEECADSVDGLLAVFSIITGVKDESYDENMRVQDIVDGEKPISPVTELYLGGGTISEEEWGRIYPAAEKRVRELELYGAYTVYYLANLPAEDMDGEKCHECMENREYLYKYSFQNFNR